MQALQAIVRGRVQGVGFRAFVIRAAQRLGVRGYTRNLPDGNVEVVAAGDGARLAVLVELLRQGPPLARVDAVESTALVSPPDCDSFEIRA